MVDRHPITPPPGLVREWLDLPLSEEEIVVTDTGCIYAPLLTKKTTISVVTTGTYAKQS
jgi:hypothetical protein